MIIYRNTFGIPLTWTLYQPDSISPYNLEGKAVRFRLWRQTDPSILLIDGDCTVTSTDYGTVEYNIQPGDFDDPGEYWAQFVAMEDGVDNVPFTTFLIQVRNVAVPA